MKIVREVPVAGRRHVGTRNGGAALVSLRQFAGKLRPYGPFLRQSIHARFALANVLSGLLPNYVSGVVRGRLYRWAGFAVDPTAFIMGNLELPSIQSGFYDKLVIGAGVQVGAHVTINLDAEVRLGRNVTVSPYVLIYTGTHQVGPGSNRRLPALVAKPITIEDGSWIGLGAIVLPGVIVGHGSIVAAGAVVTQDVPANSYVEGNPARVVNQLPWGNR